jgi:hypothetical protein
MRVCERHQADLMIDGVPYRIHDLGAFKSLRKRGPRRGFHGRIRV